MGVGGEDDSGRVYEGRKHEEEKSESVRVESVKRGWCGRWKNVYNREESVRKKRVVYR